MNIKRFLSGALCAVLLLALCPAAAADAPCEISSAEELSLLRETPDGDFVLTADIDMTGVDWTPIGNMNDMENRTTLFLGSFDGQGHTVSNLTYKNDQFIVGAGLFGISVGEIKNVNIENAAVHCTNAGAMVIGSLVGYSMGNRIMISAMKTQMKESIASHITIQLAYSLHRCY